MTAVRLGLPLAVGAVAAASVAVLALSPLWRVRKENYVGRLISVGLGWGLLAAVAVAVPAAALAFGADGWGNPFYGPVVWGFATVVTGYAGALDDAVGTGPRGIRGHVEGLLRGRVSTGIVKLVVGTVAAVWIAILAGGGPLRVAGGAVLIAVSINVWNAFDVVPGRALKLAIPVLVSTTVIAWPGSFAVIGAAVLGASLVLLPFDLAERGMLGDTGSNPLGLVCGIGLATVLPTPGLVAAAAVLLLLQLAAETVTISRLIEAVPPLRWLDGLGRRSG